MKYNTSNAPLTCIMKDSSCYKGTKTMTVKGILWHSTGANNPNLLRYVQPSKSDANYSQLLSIIGKNTEMSDWNRTSQSAGVNAWIGKNSKGEVMTVQTLPWNYRPWGCGSGPKGSCNDGWIQFEICEDSLKDKDYFNKVYKEACELTAYLCTLYKINPYGYVSMNGIKVPTILGHADSYILKVGSNHGDPYHWLSKYGITLKTIQNDVAALMNIKKRTQASDFKGCSEAAVVEAIGHLFTEDEKKTGILACVSFAQLIQESGYLSTNLAIQSNNCFGMKEKLSNNDWANSTWDGKSVYQTKTKEQTKAGKEFTITANFRKYPCIEDSIGDHSAYLAGAKNGNKLRYAGLVGEKDYKKAAQIIKNGGYATDVLYVQRLCNIIEKWNLTRFNANTAAPVQKPTQNSKEYQVKITANALNVRKGPGTQYGIAMTIEDKGTYTIVEENNGWGKLKSGAGWISLKYTRK